MKLGIMQPYFFPYLGYWQLITAVDTFVIYDDVNYIKGGWINRNRILVSGEPKYIRVPLKGASPNKLINEIEVNNAEQLINKNLRMLNNSYAKAPQYANAYPLVKSVLECGESNLAGYLAISIREICAHLGIKTKILLSSDLDKDCKLRGAEKVLSICGLLNAACYVNTIAGQHLYDRCVFQRAGIDLQFLTSEPIEYHQFNNMFIPDLSIIDVLMFNDADSIRNLLNSYQLS